MDKTQVMASATLFALLINIREDVLVSQKELLDAGVATKRGEADVLDEMGRLYIACNVRFSSLDEMHAMYQLERHDVGNDTLEEVDESSVAPKHGRE